MTSKKLVRLFLSVMVGGSLLVVEKAACQQPGTVRWRVWIGQLQNPDPSQLLSSPAIGADGTVYIGGSDSTYSYNGGNKVYAISAAGTTNWIFTTGGEMRSAPALAADGSILATSMDGFLYSIAPGGTTNWRFAGGWALPSSPAVGVDGTIYVSAISNYLNKLYAVRPDGTLKWVFKMGTVPFLPLQSGQFSSPAVGPDGTVYVGSLDKHVYAIRPDGSMNWTFALGDVTYSSPAVGADGTIYIGSDDRNVYALTPKGGVKWVFTASSYIECSAAVSRDNHVYIGSLDSRFYCLNSNGVAEWTWTNGQISASPALASDGTIYVATSPDWLFALNSSGSNIWSFSTYGGSGREVFSSPAIGPDGTVYIGIDVYLYAINGASPLEQGPWPMFRRGLNHNARAVQRGISAPVMVPGTGVSMTLTTEPNLSYRVQSSADLANWSDLSSFVSTNFSMPFVDVTASGSDWRFYRLATP